MGSGQAQNGAFMGELYCRVAEEWLHLRARDTLPSSGRWHCRPAPASSPAHFKPAPLLCPALSHSKLEENRLVPVVPFSYVFWDNTCVIQMASLERGRAADRHIFELLHLFKIQQEYAASKLTCTKEISKVS
ncbi:hypothetical protein Y1Q_0010654 [Alligator mississippiensis]|uniref:Uncharacterized protein n=1 Tax=Alligator mississippiensis TaxID=8496 RepID=A0A151M6B8_ALLMI|nr:hypothetical protein Y1Q_0010654 [Alligator mississippiensis]